jgi:hypothetical protein
MLFRVEVKEPVGDTLGFPNLKTRLRAGVLRLNEANQDYVLGVIQGLRFAQGEVPPAESGVLPLRRPSLTV